MAALLVTLPKLLVVVFLVASMAGIGLGLSPSQILVPLRAIMLVAFALLANFVVVPLLAVAIARLLRLEQPFAVGLLLLGLSAGAPFMPKVVAIARGDVALGVGLMVLLMVGTTICLPLALPLLVEGAHVNAWRIARVPVTLMIVPLLIGLIVKSRIPPIAARLRPVLERSSTLAMLAVVILIVATRHESLMRVVGTGAILAALVFSALSALAGWLLGGRDAARRTALALGTGLRNFPAALIVGVQGFPDPDVAVMILVTTLTGILVLVPAARLIGRRAPGHGDVP